MESLGFAPIRAVLLKVAGLSVADFGSFDVGNKNLEERSCQVSPESGNWAKWSHARSSTAECIHSLHFPRKLVEMVAPAVTVDGRCASKSCKEATN